MGESARGQTSQEANELGANQPGGERARGKMADTMYVCVLTELLKLGMNSGKNVKFLGKFQVGAD